MSLHCTTRTLIEYGIVKQRMGYIIARDALSEAVRCISVLNAVLEASRYPCYVYGAGGYVRVLNRSQYDSLAGGALPRVLK